MTNVIGDVTRFIDAVGQTTNVDNKEQAELYLKLIAEEYGELQEAVAAKDDVEIADAIFDVTWVALGYALSRGWDLHAIWKEGAQSNLSKIDAETGKVIRREDGKILKPAKWAPPDFSKFV
jgi:NTP pyrophosphatase (non-canonical NTP hydrolase)